jgi:hypothetical protein
MRDRRLERQVEALDDFIERWQKLSAIFRRAQQRQSPTGEQEAEFLLLKGELAQDYESLMTETGAEREPGDPTAEVLAAVPSLQRLNELGEAELRVLEAAWHRSYLQMQGLLGRLKARKLQLASVSVVGYYIGRVLRNPVVILLLLGAAVAAAVWLMNFTQDGADRLIEPRGPRPAQTEKAPGL